MIHEGFWFPKVVSDSVKESLMSPVQGISVNITEASLRKYVIDTNLNKVIIGDEPLVEVELPNNGGKVIPTRLIGQDILAGLLSAERRSVPEVIQQLLMVEFRMDLNTPVNGDKISIPSYLGRQIPADYQSFSKRSQYRWPKYNMDGKITTLQVLDAIIVPWMHDQFYFMIEKGFELETNSYKHLAPDYSRLRKVKS
jgi:hypothetical protein